MDGRPRIGIIGKGNVGTALEKGLSRAGYEVRVAGHDADEVAKVVRGAELVVLAVPYTQRHEAVEEAGGLGGRIVVDVTNALGKDNEFVGDVAKAGAEELQELVGSGKVVKAFNTVFAQRMADGHANGEALSLFAASDDDEARKTVLRVAEDLGFEPVDAGPLRNARWLETMGFLNIQLGYGQHLGTDAGFRYVHATTPAAPGPDGGLDRGPSRPGPGPTRPSPGPEAPPAP